MAKTLHHTRLCLDEAAARNTKGVACKKCEVNFIQSQLN